MTMLFDLAQTLSKGHALKNLNIHLDDPELTLHATACWHRRNKCDFRDELEEALDTLRVIRGVKKVTITGIPPALAQELTQRMESKPKSFLDLPGELRNAIYEHAADRSDVSHELSRLAQCAVERNKPYPYRARTTPTILLLNRQIHAEARKILDDKTVHLTLPAVFNPRNQNDLPAITHLISRETLQRVQKLDIRLESWEWIFSFQRLLPILAERHSLKRFHLYFRDALMPHFVAVRTKGYPDRSLHKVLGGLAEIRGVGEVTIVGDLPQEYRDPLAQIMMSPVGVDAAALSTMKAVCGDGSVVELDT